MRTILCREIVTAILEDVPASRASDNILLAEYIRKYSPNISSELREPIAVALSGRDGYSFESLRRTRQLIQRERPELRAPERIAEGRRRRSEQIKKEIAGR